MERLALDLFNNPISTDTGTLAKNTPPLDEVVKGETVPTFRALHFSSSISPSVASRTISDITLNIASSISYTLVTSTIGSQNTAVREEYGEGGRYNRLTREVNFQGGLLMERYPSREKFGFARYVIV